MLAETANALYDTKVTAEDIAKNTNGITQRIALESFVMGAMNESETERKRTQRNEAIAAERLPYINQSSGWDGQSSAAYRDPKSGKYVFVEPAEDGKWRMAFSPTAVYDENNLMIKDGLDTETVKKTLSGLAKGSLVISENGILSQEEAQREAIKQFPNTKKGRKAKKDYKREIKENQKNQKSTSKTRHSIQDTKKVIFDIKANSELAERIANSNGKKYDAIRDYIFEKLGGRELTMSDGRTVIVDKSDAKELSHRADSARTAQLGNIEKLIENAVYDNSALNVEHKKFTDFHYYAVSVRYEGEIFDLWLNVGVAKNDKKNHLYSITNQNDQIKGKKRPPITAWSRPVGNAIQNASSINSIPQNPKKSTESAKKDNRKSLADDSASGSKTAQEAQKGSQTGERAKGEQEGTSEAQRAAEAEFEGERAPEMTERERKRGYSDKEANAAREIIKDFDTMSREKRIAIVEMMRSAKANGASNTFMKHAAAMIGYWRKGLWIIADSETSEKGFYQSFEDGSRLIVVNPNAKADKGKSAIDTAFVHELAHDIWDKATAKTKDELYKMATESASAAEVDAIREKYKKGYKERGLKLDADTLREEVFANLIGNTLGNEAFLERFDLTPGRMTAFKRSIKAVTRMAKCFFGKDKYLYSKCESMARALIRVMGEQIALEAVENHSKKYDIAIDNNGHQVVILYKDVMMNQNGKPHQIIADLIAKNIGKVYTIIESGQKVYIGEDLPNEYTQSEYTKNLLRHRIKTMKLKNQIVQNFGEVIEIATNRRWEKTNHTQNKDAKYGFYRYKSRCAIPSFDSNHNVVDAKIYNFELLIRNASDGKKYLYDIVGIKKETSSSLSQSWIAKMDKNSSRSLNNSIPQNGEKSTQNAKKSFSLNDNSSAKSDGFDLDAFIQRSMENGGMIEPSAQKAEEIAKSQTAEKTEEKSKSKPKGKSKTKAELQTELKETKKENRSLKKSNEKLADSAIKAQKHSSELQEKTLRLNVRQRAARARVGIYFVFRLTLRVSCGKIIIMSELEVAMFDFGKIRSPIILSGDKQTAYRDPAVYYENGKFYLFCTYVDCTEGEPYLTTVLSISENLTDWSRPRELTVRDRSLNFSSPGNVIKTEDGYFLCLQTYCRENGEKYGNERCRVWTMRSDDMENWEEPKLLRVKGNIPTEDMGRMIDPFLVRDIKDEKKWWCLYKQNGVSMSYSYDLENWTYHGKTPCGENVCVLHDGDSYLIFHSPKNGIGVLRSENLTDFHKEGEIITLGQARWDWAQGRITAGFVLDLKNDKDYGKYIMFFHGSGPEDEETMFDFNASIGIAWSDDLKNWSYP